MPLLNDKSVKKILNDFGYIQLSRRGGSHLKYIREEIFNLILKEFDDGKLTPEEKVEKENYSSITIVYKREEYKRGTALLILKNIAEDNNITVQELKQRYHIKI